MKFHKFFMQFVYCMYLLFTILKMKVFSGKKS